MRSWMKHVAASLAALGCAAGVSAQDLRGRVRYSWQQISTEGELDGVTLMQNYEVNFTSRVSQELSWQARLRALLTGVDGETSFSSDSLLTEPFIQVVYEGAEWDGSGGARLTSVAPRGQSTTLETEREDFFGQFAWSRPERPRFDWSGYRINLKSEEVDTSTEDRSLLSMAYARPPGQLSLALENRWFVDHQTAFERDSIRITANGDFRQVFAGGRFTLGGQALIDESQIEDENPRAAVVDERRLPRNGLYADDPTPALGLLADTPALTDRDLIAPAADLSGDFRNFGVDLGFAKPVDRALVYIERRLLPGSETDYSWDVYTSDDGDQWSIHEVSAGSRFDALLNRFEIEFASTTTRFIKVVNTGFSSTEPPLAATEVEFSGDERPLEEQTFSQGRQSGNVSVSWRPRQAFDMTLSTFASRQSAGEGDDEDFSSFLTASVRPGKTVTTVRLQAVNRRSDFGPPEQERIASATFAATPLPTLDFSVTGTHRRNTSRGDLIARINSVDLRGAARFLSNVEASLDLGLRLDDDEIDRMTTRKSARLSVVTTLRPGLFLSNSWNVERFEIDGPATEGVLDRTDVDLRTRISYRPTRVLGAGVEVLYQEVAGQDGFTHAYDLDWLPFPGGALQVQMYFRQDQRSLTGNQREEWRVGTRWTMNPRTLLEVAYTETRTGDEDSPTQQLASAFLEYRF